MCEYIYTSTHRLYLHLFSYLPICIENHEFTQIPPVPIGAKGFILAFSFQTCNFLLSQRLLLTYIYLYDQSLVHNEWSHCYHCSCAEAPTPTPGHTAVWIPTSPCLGFSSLLQASPFGDYLLTLLKATVGPATLYLPCPYSLNIFGIIQFLNTDGILGTFLSVAPRPSPIRFCLFLSSIQNYGTNFNLLFAPECTAPCFSSQ